jgi:NTP pyrophosphatase (non-canonical NTP hydrolase)
MNSSFLPENNYRMKVMELWNKKLSGQQTLTAAAMGLAGESGEVVDLLKKHVFHEHPLDREKLIKEIGDTLYYAEVLMNQINVSREEVEKKNIEKLETRYPTGFSSDASLNRKD